MNWIDSITLCRKDRMSPRAAQLLAQHGFADVHGVKQGMVDWNKQGYPTRQQ